LSVRIFVGIAWPYANGPFHIGHLAGAYLPGDVFARFQRLRGNDVLMVSGSDMHGTPILVTAEQEGTTPEVVARRYDEVNRAAFERLGFSFDLYTNTHTLVHERTTQEVFLALLERRLIDRRTEQNPYCPTHRRFLPDRYLVGTCPVCGFTSARGDECDRCASVLDPRKLIEPRCALDGTPAEFRPSEHFYLRLDDLARRLTDYLADKSYWRPGVVGVARHFLSEGLHATPITRDLDWGVPIPLEGYDAKRFYVWFDAVIGYLSASREWAIRSGQPDAWRRFWDPESGTRAYYFIGKDNVFHHTIVWPSILLGHGALQLPYDVPANQWLLVGGQKVSKTRSRDQAVFVPQLLDRYPADVIRFYAAQLAPQNHDTEFDWDEFRKIGEEVLANQWGNFVQRVLVFVRNQFNGRIPEPPAGWDPREPSSVGPRLHEAHRRITEELDAVHLKEALDLIFAEIRDGNRRFHDGKPWAATDDERRRIVYEAVWLVRAAAIWLTPYLPFSSADVRRMVGGATAAAPPKWDDALEPPVPGTALDEVRPLFPKELAPPPEGPSTAPDAAATAPPPPEMPPLSIRAVTIRTAEPHPSADRLYVLTIDAGDGRERTVVAGLRDAYAADALVGRRVALLENLQPRTIRRITSQGMVLAAERDGKASLVAPGPGVPIGSTADAGPGAIREITYEEFQRTPLTIGRVVTSGPGGSEVDIGSSRVRASGSWPVDTAVVVRLAQAGASEGVIVSFAPGEPLVPEAGVPPGAKVR